MILIYIRLKIIHKYLKILNLYLKQEKFFIYNKFKFSIQQQ